MEPGKFVCQGTGPPGAELMRLGRKKGVTHGILQAVKGTGVLTTVTGSH